jgi:hypothetical protein
MNACADSVNRREVRTPAEELGRKATIVKISFVSSRVNGWID